MISADFYLKRGDLLPALTGTILNTVTGAPLNLTGAVLEFHMRNRQTGAVKIDATATIVGDPLVGRFSYAWAGTDTDTAGAYDGEIEATFAGKPLTSPNDAHFTIWVHGDLG